jgi:hypothetical protein
MFQSITRTLLTISSSHKQNRILLATIKMDKLASVWRYSRQTTRPALLVVDPRAQEIVNNEALWKALKRELKDSRATTNQAIIVITQDFMAWHFEEETDVATQYTLLKCQEGQERCCSHSSTGSHPRRPPPASSSCHPLTAIL